MVHIYNEILVSYKKEWIWVGWTEVDEPRACFTEWSKLERGNTSVIHYHTYMESRKMNLFAGQDTENLFADTENRCVDSRGRQRVEKGNHIKNEKATYGMGENVWKWHNQ